MNTILDALQTLENARTAYVQSKAAADAARKNQTDCLNRLNDAQKAFDKLVAQLRTDAPVGTDWAQEKR